MNKLEKEDKGAEEGGEKTAEQLGKELLIAAKKGEVERVKELLQCEGVDVRFGAPKRRLVWRVREDTRRWRAFFLITEERRSKSWRERFVWQRGKVS